MITRRQIYVYLWLLFATEPVSANFFDNLWTKLLNMVHICHPGPAGDKCRKNQSSGGGWSGSTGGGSSGGSSSGSEGSSSGNEANGGGDGNDGGNGNANAANDGGDGAYEDAAYEAVDSYTGGGVSEGTNSLTNEAGGASVSWLPYVIIAGILAAFIFIAVWRKRRQLNNSDLKEDLNGENKDLKGSVKERMERTTSGMPVSSLDDGASQTTFVSSGSTAYVNAASLDDAEV